MADLLVITGGQKSMTLVKVSYGDALHAVCNLTPKNTAGMTYTTHCYQCILTEQLYKTPCLKSLKDDKSVS